MEEEEEETIGRERPSSTVHDAEITPCCSAMREGGDDNNIVIRQNTRGRKERDLFFCVWHSHYTLCHSCSIKNAFRYLAPLSREREEEGEREEQKWGTLRH